MFQWQMGRGVGTDMMNEQPAGAFSRGSEPNKKIEEEGNFPSRLVSVTAAYGLACIARRLGVGAFVWRELT